ncbi:hypothetical protein J437_LFUL016369 [Ladona fulva]|uniref:Uncharacterized protein n=1 Tax=Ladona fulva TaxID=123851 RepID=A0A8K0KIP8_LADFU|nr:hypothetical protein J437_LFUL016369 [Ladona fulva]
MKRGSYKIQDGYSGSGGGKEASEYVWCESAARPPDSSYSACLLALILFLFLCVVIMLAAWPWKAGKPTTDAETDSPIRDGLSAGKMTTVSTSLPSAPEESPTVNDTLNPTSLSATEWSESTHPTFLSTETSESTTLPAVEILPKEGKTTELSDSEMVGRTMTPDTHEALVDEKEGISTSSEEEVKEFEFVLDDHCWTSACKSHASQMLALMNHSTDACHDIYAFACGGMRGEGEMLHKHNPSKSSAKKKFETFIDKCIHTDEPLGVRIEKGEFRRLSLMPNSCHAFQL